LRRKKKRFEKGSDVLVLQLPAKQEAQVRQIYGTKPAETCATGLEARVKRAFGKKAIIVKPT
jgi:hypothetical protein